MLRWTVLLSVVLAALPLDAGEDPLFDEPAGKLRGGTWMGFGPQSIVHLSVRIFRGEEPLGPSRERCLSSLTLYGAHTELTVGAGTLRARFRWGAGLRYRFEFTVPDGPTVGPERHESLYESRVAGGSRDGKIQAEMPVLLPDGPAVLHLEARVRWTGRFVPPELILGPRDPRDAEPGQRVRADLVRVPAPGGGPRTVLRSAVLDLSARSGGEVAFLRQRAYLSDLEIDVPVEQGRFIPDPVPGLEPLGLLAEIVRGDEGWTVSWRFTVKMESTDERLHTQVVTNSAPFPAGFRAHVLAERPDGGKLLLEVTREAR